MKISTLLSVAAERNEVEQKEEAVRLLQRHIDARDTAKRVFELAEENLNRISEMEVADFIAEEEGKTLSFNGTFLLGDSRG